MMPARNTAWRSQQAAAVILASMGGMTTTPDSMSVPGQFFGVVGDSLGPFDGGTLRAQSRAARQGVGTRPVRGCRG